MIYLYVKQHAKTKLKYFGRTSRNPFRYNGSGKYWVRHLKQHGYNIKTVDVWGFDDQELCTEFALKFSFENHIATSQEWANLIDEDGRARNEKYVCGNPSHSELMKMLWSDQTYINKQNKTRKANWSNPEWKKKQKAKMDAGRNQNSVDKAREKQTHNWTNEEYRKRQSEAIKLGVNTPENLERCSNKIKVQHKDPKFSAASKKGREEYWANPANREKQRSLRSNKMWVTDGVVNIRLDKGQPIPLGFRRGRTV